MRSPARFTLLAASSLATTSVASAQIWQWGAQFGGPSDERAFAAAPDGTGGVYVAGDASDAFGGPHAGASDVWLSRYDESGGRLLLTQFGSAQPDSVLGAAADGTEGVFLVGDTFGALAGPALGSSDVWIARHDSTGAQTWIRQFGTSGPESLSGVASDGVGGAFVAGSTWGDLAAPNEGIMDAFVARYDATGAQLWAVQFGNDNQNQARAAAPDGAGGVFVTGLSAGLVNGMGTQSGLDAFVARFDAAGNQLWYRQFGSGVYEVTVAAAPDGSGGVFIGGETRGSFGAPHAGSSDAWCARLDGAGNQLWVRQLGTSQADEVNGLAPDGAGGVYMTGCTSGQIGPAVGGSRDPWLARYDGTGNRLWVCQLGSPDLEALNAAAAGPAGRVYICGSTRGDLFAPAGGEFTADAWLAQWDPDGGLLTTRYCDPAVPNSTGMSGIVEARGSNSVGRNEVVLRARQLPPNAFGLFLTSQAQGSSLPPASQGILCLAGAIGRYSGPGQILSSGPAGSFELALDLTQTPTPTGLVAVTAGELWNFQAWHRDAVGGTTTSNLTDAVSVFFR